MRSTVYANGGRASVRLSLHAAAAGLLLWARQAGDIDRLPQQRLANAGGVTLSAYGQLNTVLLLRRLILITAICILIYCILAVIIGLRVSERKKRKLV